MLYNLLKILIKLIKFKGDIKMEFNERKNENSCPAPLFKAVKCIVCGGKVYTKQEILDYMVKKGTLTEDQAKQYI